jgi:hypothetical protein
MEIEGQAVPTAIYSNAFIDGKPLAFELSQDFGVYLIYGIF